MSTETPRKISAAVPQPRADADGHPNKRPAAGPPPVPGADYRRTPFWKIYGFLAQTVDHILVMDDFMADVDWRAETGERLLDDLDRPFDAGTEAARVREKDFLVVHLGIS